MIDLYFLNSSNSWNGTSSTDLRIRLEMFSSYIVSSLNTEDGLSEVGFKKLSNNDAIMDIVKVNRKNIKIVSSLINQSIKMNAGKPKLW